MRHLATTKMKSKRRPNRVSVHRMIAVAKGTKPTNSGPTASVILNGNSADVCNEAVRAELTATKWEGNVARPIEGCWQCPPSNKNSGSSISANILER